MCVAWNVFFFFDGFVAWNVKCSGFEPIHSLVPLIESNSFPVFTYKMKINNFVLLFSFPLCVCVEFFLFGTIPTGNDELSSQIWICFTNIVWSLCEIIRLLFERLMKRV